MDVFPSVTTVADELGKVPPRFSWETVSDNSSSASTFIPFDTSEALDSAALENASDVETPDSPGSDSLSWLEGTLRPRRLDDTIGRKWFDPDVRRFSTASQVQDLLGGPHAGEPVNHAQRPVLENSQNQVRDIARQAALLTCRRASEGAAVHRGKSIWAAMPLSQSPGSDSLSWLVGTLRPRRLDGTIGHMWFDPDVRRFSTASQVQGFVGGPHAGEPVNHAQRPVLENSRSQVRDIARQAALLTLTCQRAF